MSAYGKYARQMRSLSWFNQIRPNVSLPPQIAVQWLGQAVRGDSWFGLPSHSQFWPRLAHFVLNFEQLSCRSFGGMSHHTPAPNTEPPSK